MNEGWVKLYRKVLDHPRSSDPEWFSVWGHLMLLATHQDYRVIFKGEPRTLKPGQLITSRDSLAKQCGISSSKVERVLKWMESEQQIEQESSAVNRLITLINWGTYQPVEQVSEHRPDTKRTPTGHRPDTNKNSKKEKNSRTGEKEGAAELPLGDVQQRQPTSAQQELQQMAMDVLAHINTVGGGNFRFVESYLAPIRARIKEVHGDVEGIKKAIDRKAEEWLNTDKASNFNPTTLMRPTNFTRYYDQRNIEIYKPLSKPDHRAEKSAREFPETIEAKVLKI